MELLFALTPAVEYARREDILRAVVSTVPNAAAQISPDGTQLRVRVAPGADRLSVTDAIVFRLLGLGFDAKEQVQAPSITNLPPYLTNNKPARTVRLSTFIISLVCVVLAVSILAFAGGAALMSALSGGGTLGVDGTEEYRGKIGLVDTIFSQYAIYDTNGDLLLDSMLKAYVAATGDKYAEYYTQEEFDAIMAQNGGNYVGVGITVIEDKDARGILIIGVMAGSPAERAGVLPGDVVITVGEGENAVSVVEAGFTAASSAMQGEEGTVSHFTVLRDGTEIPFAITRERVEYVSVTGTVSETDPTVGIVRVTQFMLNTPVQFETEMDRLIKAGCTSFVFDMRNNPGGDLNSVKAILSYFLNEDDLIVTIVGRDESEESEYCEVIEYEDDYAPCNITEEDIGKYRQYKSAVLINENTASAAELFTAVLRDYQLTRVVGVTTYGKGVLQNVFSLEAFGYSGGLKLTTGYYNPPSGVNYDGKGVAPDGAETPLDPAVQDKNLNLLTEAEDNQLRAAVAAAVQ
ncbi:MAG: PDZ domain-containing protein [Clostridia bacterium]|nr:PDZ domain-containing protein [Clostridia bacterium]